LIKPDKYFNGALSRIFFYLLMFLVLELDQHFLFIMSERLRSLFYVSLTRYFRIFTDFHRPSAVVFIDFFTAA
jgi:hypothetical protein